MTSGDVAACLERASSCLAACSRPAPSFRADSTAEELSAALADLVASAEFFGCKPDFWRWASEAAELLGATADADKYRKRGPAKPFGPSPTSKWARGPGN